MGLRLSIRSKLLLALVSTALATAMIIVSLSLWFLMNNMWRQIDRSLEDSSRAVTQALELMEAKTLSDAEAMALRYDLQEAILANDHKALLLITRRVMQDRKLDAISVTDAEGNILARAHAPGIYGDNVAASEIVKDVLAGKATAGFGEDPVVKLYMAGGAPVFEQGGKRRLLGTVIAGQALNNEFVNKAKVMIGNEISLIINGTRQYSTLHDSSGKNLAGTRIANTQLLDQVVRDRKLRHDRIEVGGQTYRVVYSELRSRYSQVPIGVIEIAQRQRSMPW